MRLQEDSIRLKKLEDVETKTHRDKKLQRMSRLRLFWRMLIPKPKETHRKVLPETVTESLTDPYKDLHAHKK